MSLNDLRPGDCFEELAEDERAYSVPAVPCAEPHMGEVFAVFDVAPVGGWPGENPVATAVEDCAGRVARLRGVSEGTRRR